MSLASDIAYQEAHPADDRTTYIIVAITIPLVFAYIAVLLRFLARKSAAVRIRADDYLVLIGLIFTTVLAANNYVRIKLGLGKRSVDSSNIVSLAKTLIAGQILYAPTITTIKFSLAFLYHRIFLQKFKLSLILLSTILSLWEMIYVIVTGLQCRPLSSVWDRNVVGKCIDMKAFFMAMGALNVATSVFLLVLALWMLKGLKTSRMQNFLICCVLSTGFVVCALGSGRVFYASHSSSNENSYTEIKVTVWSLAECSIAIITACLPTLGVFFRQKSSMQLRSKENHQTDVVEARELESQDDAVPLQILRTVDWEICQETQAEIDRKNDESVERKMDLELKENGRQRDVIMMMASTNN